MRETAETTHRFPALDELGAEFLRVARAESRSRRRLRLRRLAVALAVTLIAVPAGFALAEDGGSDPGPVTRPIPEGYLDPPFFSARVKPLLNEPGVASRLEAMGYEGVSSMSEDEFAELDAASFLPDLRAALDASHGAPNEVNVIEGELPPLLTAECRIDPSYDPACGIALAAADGKLPSGSYTDAQLQDAVRAAGYEWSPSE
jgi:hypothetical protein